MRKNFNSVQMLETSEVCNKFSKSVSYETLVVGTTTTGREYVQNQWLSKGSANKPLSAVGTLTSLLCNSAKVKAQSFLRLRGASGAQGISAPASCREAHKRRFLFNSWILRFVCTSLRMTIPMLALILTLTTAESWAGCTNGYPYGYMKNGNCINCPSMPGTCHWDETQGKAIMDTCNGAGYKLKNGRCIIACGYKYSGCNECYYDNDENPTGCKTYACGTNKYTPCSECSYNEDGSGPIACTKCNSGYKLKDGYCFPGSISCGDGYVEGDGVCYKIPDGCESASATDGSCTKCSAGLSFDDDNNCIECNKKGYKNVGGYCNRVQWTPAEAAPLLHNDNTNEVTITFKK